MADKWREVNRTEEKWREGDGWTQRDKYSRTRKRENEIKRRMIWAKEINGNGK